MGSFLLTKGKVTLFPIKSLYLLSLGFTATAVSPNIVSGLVVATEISPYLIYQSLPFSSLYSSSKSDKLVEHLGHQLTTLSPL